MGPSYSRRGRHRGAFAEISNDVEALIVSAQSMLACHSFEGQCRVVVVVPLSSGRCAETTAGPDGAIVSLGRPEPRGLLAHVDGATSRVTRARSLVLIHQIRNLPEPSKRKIIRLLVRLPLLWWQMRQKLATCQSQLVLLRLPLGLFL